MPDKKLYIFTDFRFVTGLYLLVAIAVSLQKYFLGEEHYGNYLIFKNSFLHLIRSQDLYVLYPELKIDLFKYSPTFALLFFPFAYLPDALGMVLWNLLSVALFLFSMKGIVMDEKKKVYVLYFILIEVITSLQNFQSNLLTGALMVMTFVLLEKKNFWLAGVCVALGLYIKLFGALAVLLWFLYTEKRIFFISSLIFGIIFLISPLLIVSPSELYNMYGAWMNLIAKDAPHFLNHSIISVIKNWFNLNVNKTAVQLIGVGALVFPLIKFKQFSDKRFRLFFLCSILIWSVIFNHKAESATYIIAIIGCGLWFFNSKESADKMVLMGLLFVFSCLSSTDIFPEYLKDHWVVPYSLKALPCIFIWIRLQYDLFFYHRIEKTN